MTYEEIFKLFITSLIAILGFFFRDIYRQFKSIKSVAYDSLERTKKLEVVIEYHEKRIEENNQTHKELRDVLHSLDKTCVKLTEAMEDMKEDLKEDRKR
ncbi:hypothetical protein EHQ12_04030 [Leptospira gomenensis]|uniref:Uncharacterized protein n=1 Tax=Leptospira gomenensis TaxID=2484974 RepID=A0A5F1YDJ2_9LEPT|nr:hypothetical protein [Leptospira gomenensis]TGK36214.1 hypothetical protein EHQ17_04690 [Leptospira gomenensis]TGK42748.1 hypothetical protein EHQ07_13810 [Leptospira gomenensis]TGK42935.1 hypothetical protein EHQ12_04030 [Leptospira gomenensis]TGK54947.1 hypothetical protein EHQ13_18285 [Leptospira gomenensis]